MPGTLQLHAPGDTHGWDSHSDSLLRLGVWFTLEPGCSTVPCARWPRDPGHCRTAQKLLRDAASSSPGRADRLAARLTLLLAPALALIDLPERPAPPPNDTDDPHRIAPFVERFLSDNLTEPLTLDDVAAQVNMSVPALARRFRLETDGSVMAHLQDLRMRKAADLLRTGTLSVKEVAAAVGIPDTSYFCRCFRRAWGDSPRRFGTSAS